VIVRVLASADAAAFQAIRLQGLTECPSAFASSAEEERDTLLAVVTERLAPQDDHAMLGAFEGHALVGVVGIQREALRKLAHKGFVWGMCVAPAARRAGVGRQLMQAALEQASTRLGVTQLSLGVNAANAAAIALYERMGFETYGLEHGSMRLDCELHDEILMVRVL